jgi:hypothetical protein
MGRFYVVLAIVLFCPFPLLFAQTNWIGFYKITSVCPASCCCYADSINVIQGGTTIVFSGSFAGTCMSIPPNFVLIPPGFVLSDNIQLPSLSVTKVTYNYLGNQYSASISGNNLTINDLNNVQCITTATRSASAFAISPMVLAAQLAFILLMCILM